MTLTFKDLTPPYDAGRTEQDEALVAGGDARCGPGPWDQQRSLQPESAATRLFHASAESRRSEPVHSAIAVHTDCDGQRRQQAG